MGRLRWTTSLHPFAAAPCGDRGYRRQLRKISYNASVVAGRFRDTIDRVRDRVDKFTNVRGDVVILAMSAGRMRAFVLVYILPHKSYKRLASQLVRHHVSAQMQVPR